MSEIPAIDNIFHIVMTAIHPVMGFINALAPNLGDPTAYTQGPLAVFGGSQALILHALKLLVRLAGCACFVACGASNAVSYSGLVKAYK